MYKDRITGAAKGIRGSITELTLSLGKTIDDAKLVRPAFERKQGEPMTDLADSMVTFPIAGGIFGVGRLATSLKTLQSVGHIGPWHVGHWVDFTHTAIRIRFDSVVDAQVATRECVR
jgi:hypothetical protein